MRNSGAWCGKTKLRTAHVLKIGFAKAGVHVLRCAHIYLTYAYFVFRYYYEARGTELPV